MPPSRKYLWAHPRSRGEHNTSSESLEHWEGSSPLARGTLFLRRGRPETSGLIPARAGNTAQGIQRRPHRRAHPRSRGEHPALSTRVAGVAGSSPLARGTRLVGEPLPGGHGLIPARAGNTRAALMFECGSRAHPRSRGEHARSTVRVAGVAGSSPLARGTQVVGRRSTRRPGLIPARAGNTETRRPLMLGAGAHPRSRGEHELLDEHDNPVVGSSPLARGTQNVARQLEALEGLIPARAGNTRCI